MKRSSFGRTFGAQLLADPSAPRRWLRRLSSSGDGTFISCTLADGITTLAVRGRTPQRTAPSSRPGRYPQVIDDLETAALRLDDVYVHADVALAGNHLAGVPGPFRWVAAIGSARHCKFYGLKMQRE